MISVRGHSAPGYLERFTFRLSENRSRLYPGDRHGNRHVAGSGYRADALQTPEYADGGRGR